jgi:hypothetical protein
LFLSRHVNLLRRLVVVVALLLAVTLQEPLMSCAQSSLLQANGGTCDALRLWLFKQDDAYIIIRCFPFLVPFSQPTQKFHMSLQ